MSGCPAASPLTGRGCSVQTWHQCKVVWVDGMAPTLARLPPATTHITEEQGGEEASLLGSLAPTTQPALPPAALQCHFKPLTGEVCIGEAPPAPVEGSQSDNGAHYSSSMPVWSS